MDQPLRKKRQTLLLCIPPPPSCDGRGCGHRPGGVAVESGNEKFPGVANQEIAGGTEAEIGRVPSRKAIRLAKRPPVGLRVNGRAGAEEKEQREQTKPVQPSRHAASMGWWVTTGQLRNPPAVILAVLVLNSRDRGIRDA